MGDLDPKVEDEEVEEATTMPLRDALANLAPLAEALVSIAYNFDEIDQIEAQANEAQALLAIAQEETAAAEAAKTAAEAAAVDAKAELIEAEAKCHSMIEAAREVAARLIDEAKQQAVADAETTKASYSDSISLLTSEKAKAQAELDQLQQEIKDARVTHDQVLASMGSLSKRLGAA